MVWKISCHVSAKGVTIPDIEVWEATLHDVHLHVFWVLRYLPLTEWPWVVQLWRSSGCSQFPMFNMVSFAKWHHESGRGCTGIRYTLHYRAIIILGIHTNMPESMCKCIWSLFKLYMYHHGHMQAAHNGEVLSSLLSLSITYIECILHLAYQPMLAANNDCHMQCTYRFNVNCHMY